MGPLAPSPEVADAAAGDPSVKEIGDFADCIGDCTDWIADYAGGITASLRSYPDAIHMGLQGV